MGIEGESKRKGKIHLTALIEFFSPLPPHVLVDFVVLTPGHGRNVSDF